MLMQTTVGQVAQHQVLQQEQTVFPFQIQQTLQQAVVTILFILFLLIITQRLRAVLILKQLQLLRLSSLTIKLQQVQQRLLLPTRNTASHITETAVLFRQHPAETHTTEIRLVKPLIKFQQTEQEAVTSILVCILQGKQTTMISQNLLPVQHQAIQVSLHQAPR